MRDNVRVRLSEKDRKLFGDLIGLVAEGGPEANTAGRLIAEMSSRLGITGDELKDLFFQASSVPSSEWKRETEPASAAEEYRQEASRSQQQGEADRYSEMNFNGITFRRIAQKAFFGATFTSGLIGLYAFCAEFIWTVRAGFGISLPVVGMCIAIFAGGAVASLGINRSKQLRKASRSTHAHLPRPTFRRIVQQAFSGGLVATGFLVLVLSVFPKIRDAVFGSNMLPFALVVGGAVAFPVMRFRNEVEFNILSWVKNMTSADDTSEPPRGGSVVERAPNEHILPPEIQQLLPAGSRVMSYDGELVYRTTVPAQDTHLVDYRMYSLTPVIGEKYARRWEGKPVQETYLSIENFHGHLVTMYFLFLPDKGTARTGLYRAESIAAVSLSTKLWLSVTLPKAVELIFEGPIQGRMIRELLRVMRPGGYAKRLDKNDQSAVVLDQVVMFLRFEFEKNEALERGRTSGGRI